MAELAVLSTVTLEPRPHGSDVTVGTFEGWQLVDELATRSPFGAAVVVSGVSWSLVPTLRPGQLVVATELRQVGTKKRQSLPAGSYLARELEGHGLAVSAGPVISAGPTQVPVDPAALLADGAVAVDRDSFALCQALGDRARVVVLAVSGDLRTSRRPGHFRAMASLLAARPTLERWAEAIRPRTVLLAKPRSFCAGVERAITTVERALERYGAPLYVRRQIVHNSHVVEALEAKGAVFVQELDEVPDGATVVLAAHGVSPAVREDSERRELSVIDATCPLVAKVHKEVTRFAAQDHDIVLIGHVDHEEVVGTMGEAPDRIHLVEKVEDVAGLALDAQAKVGYLTQTTLAADETAEIVDALSERFPNLVGPPAADICYATQNRQDAVREMAGRCDLLLVVGSSNSSNSNRLVEVARRQGCRAELIEDEHDLQLKWLEGVATVGVTAGASAPELLVQRTVSALGLFGPLDVEEVTTTVEAVTFALPRSVR